MENATYNDQESLLAAVEVVECREVEGEEESTTIDANCFA